MSAQENPIVVFNDGARKNSLIMKTAEGNEAIAVGTLSLGKHIKRLRIDRELTLKDVSARAGIAFGTLSKIENDQMSPTYEVLLKVAAGLSVEIASLFPGNVDKELKPGPMARRSITKRGCGTTHESPQYSYELSHAELTKKKMLTVNAVVKARAVEEFGDPLPNRGEEFLFVLSGSVRVYLEHYEPTDLSEGDSVYFDSPMGRACISTSKKNARVLWVFAQDD
jgi:transcriptional regulator with XRE-family HTH domain